ncbi:HNH endonuclease [Shewanella sp.]|uniref:YecA family protein n=1 Tax=Shewanella sp. TaxID=50422 RepID=UPI001EC72E56|nr:HNH endonuclease [Shewanella sp.]NRB25744.1 HNH endonuclease [Shewanella sp.]
MNRIPKIAVIRELRNEVGFGCPVKDCANPYLEWHHFDPPWRIENHHNPEGMIALCTNHHKKADGGAYTNDQLQNLKKNTANAEKVKGQFDWLRNELIAVVGNIFYHKVNNIIEIDGKNVIWFNRDEDGYLRLNVRMLSIEPEERAVIDDNIWMNIGSPKDLHSPPQGKELKIDYENGDHLFVKFIVLETAEQAFNKYDNKDLLDIDLIHYPITVVEINYKIGGTGIEFRSKSTNISNLTIGSGFISNCHVGVSINPELIFRQNPSLLPYKPSSRVKACPCGSGYRYKQCHGLIK